MRARRLRWGWLCLGLFLLSTVSVAEIDRAEEEWTAEGEVPQITVPANASAQERAQAQYIRKRMVHTVQYWKDHGLPNPPDLESVIYFADYRGLKVREFVAVQNPGLADVGSHIEEQYRHFLASRLYLVIQKLQSSVKVSKGKKKKSESDGDSKEEASAQTETTADTESEETKADSESEKKTKLDLPTKFFDLYARIRYGASVPDFYQHYQKDTSLADIESSSDDALMHDNAFYAKVPSIDLTKLLKPAEEADKTRSLGELLSDALNMDELNSLSKRNRFSPRIVLVPRTTQTVGDPSVSTLWDETVTLHELGHHMGHTLAASAYENGTLDRIIDEVFADYLAAAPTDNPKIGQYFASVSAIIAERLANGDPDPTVQYLSYRLKKLGERAILRDLSVQSTIDELPRYFSMADDYTGGNPLRGMLWHLRQTPEVNPNELDEVLVQSLVEFGKLPRVIAGDTSLVLTLRSLWRQAMQYLGQQGEEIRMAKEQNLDRTKLAKDEKKAFEIEAEKSYRAKQKAEEARRLSRHAFWQRFGLGDRPPIKSDYVLPEYLRSVYRVASARNAELAERIRTEGSKILGARSVLIPTSMGPELIFPRSLRNTLNPLERFYLAWHGRSTANAREAAMEARKEMQRFAEENPALMLDAAKVKELPLSKSKAQVDARYDRRLAQRAAYERTGNPLLLVVPHPFFSTARAVGKVGLKCVELLGKAFGGKRSTETAQTSTK